MVIDEIFTNISNYAYKDSGTVEVITDYEQESCIFSLIFQDDGEPFDPLSVKGVFCRMKLFSYESRFSQWMLRISYACCLNVLWFICSLPIITIGASTSALYYISLKIVRGEEGHVFSSFFRSFKENFRQATVIWLIMLFTGAFLGVDGYIAYHLRASSSGAAAVFWTLVLALLIGAAVVYTIVLLYVFPLVGTVSNTTPAMFKNAFLIGTHYLFATILVFAVHFGMFFAVVRIFTPLIIFGEGLCAMISAGLLDNVLRACSYDPAAEQDSSDGRQP